METQTALETLAAPALPGPREIRLNRDTGLLKLIACACMMCDHMGKMVYPFAYRLSATGPWAFLLPTINVLRAVGRLAMPMFAYGIAVGCLKTRSVWKYILRLLLMGILVQPLYQEAMGHVPLNSFHWADSFWRLDLIYDYYYSSNLNIFFTLSLGALLIGCFRNRRFVFTVLAALLAWTLRGRIDYGYRGVVLICLFYLFIDRPLASFAAVFLYMVNWAMPNLFSSFKTTSTSQLYALLALPLIYLPLRRRRVILPKWFYYGFYPAHLTIIYLLISVDRTFWANAACTIADALKAAF
jgi:TraX protein.